MLPYFYFNFMLKKIYILFLSVFFLSPGFVKKSNAEEQFPLGKKSEIKFIENKNQWQKNILFKAELPSGALFIEPGAFTYSFFDGESFTKAIGKTHSKETARYLIQNKTAEKNKIKFHAFRAEFKNYNTKTSAKGKTQYRDYQNFFLGNDKSKWSSEVHSYQTIEFTELYPNINLSLYSYNNSLKYDLIVNPGGKTSAIEIAYTGASKIALENGNLLIKTSVNEVLEQKPYAYQIINNQKITVACQFVLLENTVSFNFSESYDTTKVLYIDPELIFSSYSGSFANNFGYTATYDNEGYLYAGSSVFGVGYPTTLGAFEEIFKGGIIDMAISKYDTTGTKLIYSTYIGGSGDELPHSLIVDPKKNELLIFGTTSSIDYPTTAGSYDTSFNGGSPINMLNGLGINYENGSDIVISKLNSNGNTLLNSTFVGGSGNDGINSLNNDLGYIYNPLKYNYADEVRGEIMLDKNNNIYISSCTRSKDFPIYGNSFQKKHGGGEIDGIIIKLDQNLREIIWSSYLGGKDLDAAYGIVLDSKDNLYVTGGTKSEDFPISSDVIYNKFNGGRADGFITHIDKSGNQILKSSYFGSKAYDQTYLIQIDKNNDVFILGQTQGQADLFIKNAKYNTPGAGQFITKLNSDLDSVIWSTRFGTAIGVPNISPVAFMVDLCNKIYLTGWGGEHTNGFGGTKGMETTSDAFQSTTDNNDFYLMVMQDDANSLYYASFFGGDQSAEHVDGGTSRFDRTGKIYQSVCAGCNYTDTVGNSDFPIYPNPGAYSTKNNSYCNNAVFKFDFSFPEIFSDFDPPLAACQGTKIEFRNKSLGGKKFTWHFGNNIKSNENDAWVVFDKPGIYYNQLITYDSTSCNNSDTITKALLILGDTSYTFEDKYACGGNKTQIGLPNINTEGLNIRWIPTEGLSDTNVTNPFANPSLTTNYTLVVSKNGCSDTIHQQVIVISEKLRAFADTAICLGVTAKISASGNGFYKNFTFSANADYSNPISQGIDSVINVNPNESTTYYISGANDFCMVSDKVKVYVVGNSSIIADSLYNCPANPLQIGILPLVGTNFTYNWTPDIGLSNSKISNPLTSSESSIDYTLVISNGFCQDTIKQHIEILSSKKTILPELATCKNMPVQIGLNVNPNPSIEYLWFPNKDLVNSNMPNPIANPENSTNYYMYLYNGKCWDLYSQLVNIYPDSLIINNDTTICNSDTVKISVGFSDYYTNYIWSSNFNFTDTLNKSLIDSSLSFFITKPTTLFLKANNKFCTVIDSIRIGVLQNASYNLPTVTSCSGDSVQIGVSNLYGKNNDYFWSPSIGLSNPKIANPFAYALENTTYTLIASNGFCKDSIIAKLNVNNLTMSLTEDSTICKNSSMFLYAFGNGQIDKFTWSSKSNFSDTLNSNTSDSSLFISPLKTTKYYIKGVNENCQKTDSTIIYVLKDSLLNSNSGIICKGEKLLIGIDSLPGNNLTYSWFPSTNLSNSSIPNPFAYPTNTTNYKLIVSNGYCADTMFNQVMVIKDTLTNLTPKHICGSGVVEIGFVSSSNNDINYNWIPEIGLSNAKISNPLASPAISTLYSLEMINGNCRDTFNQLVHVYPLTQALTNDSAICKGSNIKLSAKSNGIFKNFHWSSKKNFTDTLNISFLDSSILIYPQTKSTYYLKSSIETCTIVDSVKIDVISNSSKSFDNLSICLTDSVLIGIDSSLSSGVSYTWQSNLGTINTDKSIFYVKPDSDITYKLIVSNGYCADTVYQHIMVTDLSLKLTPDTMICFGNAINISASTPTLNTEYLWSVKSNFSDTLNNSASFLYEGNKSGNIYLKVTKNACNKVDSIKISVSKVDFSTKSVKICLGDSIYLKAENQNINDTLKYTWKPENYIIGNNLNDSILIKPEHSLNYYLGATNQYGCEKKDTVNVLVSNLKSKEFIVNTKPDSILRGQSAVLSVSPSLGYLFSWSPEETLEKHMAPSTVAKPELTTNYTVKISDGLCSIYDSVKVKVFEIICGEPNIYIPNAFTPNDDSNNDKVFVRGNYIKELYFSIYNRWGEMVFETKDQNTGWDGTYKGVMADPGVFVYYLTITCQGEQTHFTKGNITLIR